MASPLDYVLDALDMETFFVCTSEAEGKQLAIYLMSSLGFEDVDVVYIKFSGSGQRVRVRAYINRPGDVYPWLDLGDAGEVRE
jgi:hypothetical protein